MSGSDKDDLLSQFLPPTKRGERRATPAPVEGESGGGLNPLELLDLPPAQRDLINWLSRRKQARFDDLLEALGVEPAHLTDVITALKEARHIQEALIDGEIYFRVVFAGKVSRAGRGLPASIWERVDLDNNVFLRQVALFRGLTESDLHEISTRLDTRHFRRNEVILWQGAIGEGVYFIKSGIIGITRLKPGSRETQILTYLKQGDLLGEYGLLFEQNAAASSTATALSEVEVLVMKRQDMLDLLKDYPSVAVELVQLLAQRLLATEALPQSPRTEKRNTICLVFGTGTGAGGTTIGTALAMSLARATQQETVYTEHPASHTLPPQFGFPPETEVYVHPSGYDIFVPHGLSGAPATVRVTLLMDRLMSNYANIVIGVSGVLDEPVVYLLERADQVVIVTPPDAVSWEQLKQLRTRLKTVIRPEQTSLSVVCNRSAAGLVTSPVVMADFDIPWQESLGPLAQRTIDRLPDALRQPAAHLANRVGRTNQIGIYLPTLLESDPSANMQPVVDRTRAFLETLFGSAPAPALVSSEQSAAGQHMQLIQTYATKSAMDQHLGAVLAFVEQLKTELGLDVMALEVNHQVMVV